jgi:hypothetical protein
MSPASGPQPRGARCEVHQHLGALAAGQREARQRHRPRQQPAVAGHLVQQAAVFARQREVARVAGVEQAQPHQTGGHRGHRAQRAVDEHAIAAEARHQLRAAVAVGQTAVGREGMAAVDRLEQRRGVGAGIHEGRQRTARTRR